MGRPTDAVKIIAPSWSEYVNAKGEDEYIVIGTLDLATLSNISVDDYQRGRKTFTELKVLIDAVKKGASLPPIDLGMRGQAYDERDDIMFLRDPVFVIDGLQRMTATQHVMQQNPNLKFSLRVTVHFSTDKAFEAARFRMLNSTQKHVSPNKLLANERDTSPALAAAFGLCASPAFALQGRVQWGDAALRSDLISGKTLLMVWGYLHTHKGSVPSSNWHKLYPQLDATAKSVGLMNMKDNLKTFINLVDECWGIKTILHRATAVHLRGPFLTTLARFLSDHYEFWQDDERKLFVEVSLRRKLAAFAITSDQGLMNLAGSGGKSRDIMYSLLRDHMNYGKRTKRLVSRRSGISVKGDIAEEQSEAA